MNFSSIGGSNAGKYAQAGKAVADSSARVFDAQRKSAPNYTMLSKVAMQARSNEKIAAMQTEAAVTKQGIKILEDKTKMGHQISVFNDKLDRANSQRKAGAIAAIGKVAGAAILSRDNTKDREYPTSNFDEMYKAYKAKKDSITSKYDSDTNALGDGPSSNGVSSSSTSGDSSGKAVSGGSSDTTTTGTGSSGSDPLAGLTSKDFDDMAYTISSEAQLGTDDVYGVAANLVTRLRSGKYGDSIHAISHAPGQYEGVYTGRSKASPQISAQLQTPEGRAKIIDFYNRLDGRTEFKGQSQLHNRVAKEDPMFDPKGNFYHYAGQ